MTDELTLLRAVAEAARAVVETRYVGGTWEALKDAIATLSDALDALPTPAQDSGEAVRLAVWRNRDGAMLFDIAGSKSDVGNGSYYTRLGVVTLSVAAELERGE